MAIAEYKTGSGVTISTTEYSLVTPGTTLATDATDGVYQVFINPTAMAAGDEYLFQVKEKVATTSSQATVYSLTLEGAQSYPLAFPSLILMHGWDVTVKKIAGTDRAFDWSIRKVA